MKKLLILALTAAVLSLSGCDLSEANSPPASTAAISSIPPKELEQSSEVSSQASS